MPERASELTTPPEDSRSVPETTARPARGASSGGAELQDDGASFVAPTIRELGNLGELTLGSGGLSAGSCGSGSSV